LQLGSGAKESPCRFPIATLNTSATSTSLTTKEDRIVAFSAQHWFANAPQCDVVRTFFNLVLSSSILLTSFCFFFPTLFST
jgi:hypothetical protein